MPPHLSPCIGPGERDPTNTPASVQGSADLGDLPPQCCPPALQSVSSFPAGGCPRPQPLAAATQRSERRWEEQVIRHRTEDVGQTHIPELVPIGVQTLGIGGPATSSRLIFSMTAQP